jgi:hypothetical protein
MARGSHSGFVQLQTGGKSKLKTSGDVRITKDYILINLQDAEGKQLTISHNQVNNILITAKVLGICKKEVVACESAKEGAPLMRAEETLAKAFNKHFKTARKVTVGQRKHTKTGKGVVTKNGLKVMEITG